MAKTCWDLQWWSNSQREKADAAQAAIEAAAVAAEVVVTSTAMSVENAATLPATVGAEMAAVVVDDIETDRGREIVDVIDLDLETVLEIEGAIDLGTDPEIAHETVLDLAIDIGVAIEVLRGAPRGTRGAIEVTTRVAEIRAAHRNIDPSRCRDPNRDRNRRAVIVLDRARLQEAPVAMRT